MKKFILSIVVLGVSLPLVAGAEVFRPLMQMNQNQRQELPQSSPLKKEMQEKKPVQQEADLPSLKPFQKLPQNLSGGLEKHAELIQLQLDHLDTSQVPPGKRDMVRTELEAELLWIAEVQGKLQQAESEEEKQALQAEVAQHITQLKEDRRQRLAQAAELPTESPFNKAEEVGVQFQVVVDRLEEQGEDVSQLKVALEEYVSSVQAGQQIFVEANEQKTYEQLVALRDQLQLVRQKGRTMRNLLQSLLETAPLDVSNS